MQIHIYIYNIYIYIYSCAGSIAALMFDSGYNSVLMYVYTHTSIYIFTWIYKHTYTYMEIRLYTHSCTHEDINTYTCMGIRWNTHSCAGAVAARMLRAGYNSVLGWSSWLWTTFVWDWCRGRYRWHRGLFPFFTPWLSQTVYRVLHVSAECACISCIHCCANCIHCTNGYRGSFL